MIAPATQAPKSTALLDHLSWSGLQTYQACPRRFFHKYIAGTPHERRSAALIFGGAIHAAIEKVHEARLAGEQLPSTESLVAAYEAAWLEQAAESTPILFAKGEDVQSLRALAARMLSVYRDGALKLDGTVVGIEHEARVQMVPGAPPLQARIDLLEANGGELIITDFKTSRSRWNDATVREHLQQVVIYAHAAAGILRALGATRIVTRFVVLTKAKAPIVQVLEPRPSEADVSRLKELVSETWHAIQKQAWLRREGWHCKQCPFSNRCLGRATT